MKRKLIMERALKIIQIWSKCDAHPENPKTRKQAMKDIEELALRALRKGKQCDRRL